MPKVNTTLILIDEVHLLNEDRGSTLEAIVSRYVDTKQELLKCCPNNIRLQNEDGIGGTELPNPLYGYIELIETKT